MHRSSTEYCQRTRAGRAARVGLGSRQPAASVAALHWSAALPRLWTSPPPAPTLLSPTPLPLTPPLHRPSSTSTLGGATAAPLRQSRVRALACPWRRAVGAEGLAGLPQGQPGDRGPRVQCRPGAVTRAFLMLSPAPWLPADESDVCQTFLESELPLPPALRAAALLPRAFALALHRAGLQFKAAQERGGRNLAAALRFRLVASGTAHSALQRRGRCTPHCRPERRQTSPRYHCCTLAPLHERTLPALHPPLTRLHCPRSSLPAISARAGTHREGGAR